jgi:Bacterial Ig domain
VVSCNYGSAACLFAQATLQITTPTDGTVVNPGQKVVVNVSATGGPFTGVGLIAPGNLTSTQALTAPPYQFSFTVPSSAQIRRKVFL